MIRCSYARCRLKGQSQAKIIFPYFLFLTWVSKLETGNFVSISSLTGVIIDDNSSNIMLKLTRYVFVISGKFTIVIQKIFYSVKQEEEY